MKIISTRQAALALQVSEDTVLRLIRANELTAERLGKRGRYRIIKSSLTEFAERQRITLLINDDSTKV